MMYRARRAFWTVATVLLLPTVIGAVWAILKRRELREEYETSLMLDRLRAQIAREDGESARATTLAIFRLYHPAVFVEPRERSVN